MSIDWTPMQGTALLLLFFATGACRAAEAPAGEGAIRILPLGDSITEGFTAGSTYRSWLWRDLEKRGHRVDFVGSLQGTQAGGEDLDFDADHEGHWGWRADEVRDRVAVWAEASRPDIVLIHLGHNDLWGGQSVESTAADIAEIVAIVRRTSPDATFLLAEIIPASVPGLEEIPAFNREIGTLAQSLSTSDSPVFAVDLAAGFDPFTDTVDGVHPNQAGAQKMARAWLHALTGILPDEDR